MANTPKFARPSFSEALAAWKQLLAQRQLPSDVIWIFDENLCWEKKGSGADAFQAGFQIKMTPPPGDAGQIAFDYFCEFEARIVFYRMGTWQNKSVCLMLCDEWFESKGDKEGFVRRDDWLLSFRPGSAGEVEEIVDEDRWRHRVLRDRPLHDLDFCMSLRAVHEILAHGRALTAYEHYALRFLGAWRRLLGEKG